MQQAIILTLYFLGFRLTFVHPIMTNPSVVVSPLRSGKRYGKRILAEYLLVLFILVGIIRILIAQNMGLMPQDAYYFYYSEHPALSYYDHPPMIAYLLKSFTFLFGKSELVIKLANLTLTTLTLLVFYLLSRQFLNKLKASNTLILLGSTIMVTNLSVVSLPDVPLVFFWTLSLLLLYKALFVSKGYLYWAMAGLTMGLAFNSKYTAVFLLFVLALFLLVSRQHRMLLVSRRFVLLLLVFILTITPVVYWNMQNDWISFAFQSKSRFSTISEFNFKPTYFFANIGLQMLLLMPVLFVAMFTVLGKLSIKALYSKSLPDSRKLFLLSFSVPVISFFFVLSSVYWVKSNWLLPAYIAVAIVVGMYLVEKQLKWHLILSVVFHLVLLVQVLFYPVPVKSDDTWWGWDKLAASVKSLKREYPGYFVVSDDGYKTSAVLNFYMDEPIYAGNVIGKHGLQFSLTHADLSHLNGKNAIFLDSKSRFTDTLKSNETDDELNRFFEKVTELEPIIITDENGTPIRKFLVYKCEHYNYEKVQKNKSF
ncbi:ArnT family glycosyltransferase [Pontibacter sp. H249]|uniref:ArnT family glycosyltransferase n=1 Tax=Pontibacter sp. H249 TaxID=3133420 RepID=UPI0030C0D0CC